MPVFCFKIQNIYIWNLIKTVTAVCVEQKTTVVDNTKAKRLWPPSGFPDKGFSFSVSALIQDVLVKTQNNDPDITLELHWPAQEVLPVLQLFKRQLSIKVIHSMVSPQSAWIQIFLFSKTLEWNPNEWGLETEYSKIKSTWVSSVTAWTSCPRREPSAGLWVEWRPGQGECSKHWLCGAVAAGQSLLSRVGVTAGRFCFPPVLGHLQSPGRTGWLRGVGVAQESINSAEGKMLGAPQRYLRSLALQRWKFPTSRWDLQPSGNLCR